MGLTDDSCRLLELARNGTPMAAHPLGWLRRTKETAGVVANVAIAREQTGVGQAFMPD